MRTPPTDGRHSRIEDRNYRRLSTSTRAARQLPELGRRAQAYHEAMILWRVEPWTTPPQPRFFCLHLPDLSAAELERWRRNDG